MEGTGNRPRENPDDQLILLTLLGPSQLEEHQPHGRTQIKVHMIERQHWQDGKA